MGGRGAAHEAAERGADETGGRGAADEAAEPGADDAAGRAEDEAA
jgi:hypothetical protein